MHPFSLPNTKSSMQELWGQWINPLSTYMINPIPFDSVPQSKAGWCCEDRELEIRKREKKKQRIGSQLSAWTTFWHDIEKNKPNPLTFKLRESYACVCVRLCIYIAWKWFSLCVSVVNIYHILSDWVKLCWNSPTLIYACVHRCLNFHMKVICWQASEVLNRITDTSQTTAFVSARQKGMWMCVLEYLHSVSDRLTEWQPSLVVSQNM